MAILKEKPITNKQVSSQDIDQQLAEEYAKSLSGRYEKPTTGLQDLTSGDMGGLIKMINSPEMYQAMAVDQSPEMRNALMEQGDKRKGEQSALEQAYAQSEQERIKNIGEYTGKQAALQKDYDIASMQGSLERQKAVSDYAQNLMKTKNMKPEEAFKLANAQISGGSNLPTEQRGWLWKQTRLAPGQQVEGNVAQDIEKNVPVANKPKPDKTAYKQMINNPNPLAKYIK